MSPESSQKVSQVKAEEALGVGKDIFPGQKLFKLVWQKTIFRLVFIFFILLFATLITLRIFHKETVLKTPLPVMTVTTVPVQCHNLDRHLSMNGSVSAWDPLSIGAEVNGLRIEAVLVEEGDMVKRGQVLATLNSSILRAELEQEKARLEAKEAGLKKAIQPNRIEDLNSYQAILLQSQANVAQEEANLARAKSNCANAEENAKRYSGLRKLGAVSQMEADNSMTTARAAEAELTTCQKRVEAMTYVLRQAKETLSMAEHGGRQEDILISQAEVAETKARIKQLTAQIEQTIIRSPDDGKVIKKEAHIGEITTAGKLLFKLVRSNRLELRALVPEADLPKIKPGQIVKMTAGMKSNSSFLGFVREVSPAVEETTRLGTVHIDIPENNDVVKPGAFFHGDILLGAEQVMAVPAKSVLSRDDKSVVFVLRGDKAKAQEVEEGEMLSGGMIEIRSGLRPQDEVICSGAGFLRDGDVVRKAALVR